MIIFRVISIFIRNSPIPLSHDKLSVSTEHTRKKNRLKKANATRQIQNENIFGANAFVRYWELLPNTHTYTELHTHTSAPQSAQTFVYITPRLRVK